MFLGLDASTLNFLLPFLLVLAIVYGALEMSGPIKNKAARFIISLVLAIFAATYEPAVVMINQLLPYAAGLFVVVFLLGFIKSLFRGEKGKETDFTLLAIIAGLAAIFFAGPVGSGLFGTAASLGPISSENLAAAAGLLFVLIMLVVAYKNWSEK